MQSVLTKPYYSVYAIRCKKNNKVYIGISKNPSARIEQHFSELRKNQKDKKIEYGAKQSRGPSEWQTDFDKYGEESFECYILETDVANSKAHEKEAFYIAMYESSNPDFGYNLYSEHNKLKMPLKSMPPNASSELMSKYADLSLLSKELKILADFMRANYFCEDITASIMHLQRISSEFLQLTDNHFVKRGDN